MGHNAFVFGIEGRVIFGPHELESEQLAVLGQDGAALNAIAGDEGARFLLVAGKPLEEPVSRGGPFVMNHAREIKHAFADYNNGVLT